ncbi:p12 [Spodoptera littoralis nucleopolyhedrovirus]|uniref:p12 n=1 Tax=Spodoptera littoralis nuclear polyhedrosis virus TaxID=10456 RepID=M1JSL9_NPVSL|nr:p12 [Spodoptera littoralis nucleopolyhedrovirus]AGE89942.1 p12 [Spodoptera littoralis nucleopolyhedrovirus]AYU75276.1 p12 [Spodoptera littoralis nucleopolyhedrovirus]
MSIIVTPDDILSGGGGGRGGRNRSRRRREEDGADDDAANNIDPSQIINELNDVNTSAHAILADRSDNRLETLQLLANQSNIAKKIVTSVNNRDDRVKFNVVETMELLRLMTDLYDNKFLVTE